jgi:hypothetical protein
LCLVSTRLQRDSSSELSLGSNRNRAGRGRYGNGYRNEIIWPLFHDLQSFCNFVPEYWTSAHKVDRRADARWDPARVLPGVRTVMALGIAYRRPASERSDIAS